MSINITLQSESYIEGKVCKYAESLGVEQRKFVTPNRRSAPDRIFFAMGGCTLFIEFKKKGGKTTSGQDREISRLKALGFPVHVVDNIEDGKQVISNWVEEIGAFVDAF